MRGFVFVAGDSLCKKKRASEHIWISRRLMRRVESCAPSTALRAVPLPRCRGGGWRFDNAAAGSEERRNVSDREKP